MLINDIPKIMINALLLTIIVELIFAFILGARNKKDFINILLVNIITNPIVNGTSIMVNLYWGYSLRNIVLIILELLAIFMEGFAYKKTLNYKKINPFIFSLILNGLSYIFGLILL